MDRSYARPYYQDTGRIVYVVTSAGKNSAFLG